MTIRDDIAALRATSSAAVALILDNPNLTDDEKALALQEIYSTPEYRAETLDVYNLKLGALRDVILNGKPAPNPIPPLINRTFTLDGTSIRVNACSTVAKNGVPQLFIDVTLTRAPLAAVTHQVYYTNPPVIPKTETGNAKQDLIQCVSEMLAQLPVT